MKKKIKFNNNIAETLLITVYMKAIETMKKNPIIQDENALKMIHQMDYDFDKFNKAKGSAVGVCIRAKLFDNIVKEFIQTKKSPVIIIVGCGLDARRERIGELANETVFYNIDLPEVIDIREDYFPASNKNRYIRCSMLEDTWAKKIIEEQPWGDFLFIIEGVFMYFSEKDIKAFFHLVNQNFVSAELHFDVINEWMSKNSHKHDTVKLMNAEFVWGINDDKVFEKWIPEKLEHQKTYLFTDFPEWKRAGIKGLLIKNIPAFKYAGRMLSYKLKD